jgi:hypothetical protein
MLTKLSPSEVSHAFHMMTIVPPLKLHAKGEAFPLFLA